MKMSNENKDKKNYINKVSKDPLKNKFFEEEKNSRTLFK